MAKPKTFTIPIPEEIRRLSDIAREGHFYMALGEWMVKNESAVVAKKPSARRTATPPGGKGVP